MSEKKWNEKKKEKKLELFLNYYNLKIEIFNEIILFFLSFHIDEKNFFFNK